MYYDREKIYDFLSGRDVAEMLGMEIHSMGHRETILCPDKEHNDRHFGSCFLTNKGCHCFVCQKNMNLEEMVMKQTGVSYIQSLQMLSEYAKIDPVNNSNAILQSIIRLPFTKEEFELMGFCPNDAGISVVTEFNFQKKENTRVKRDPYDITMQAGYMTMQTAWKNPLKDLFKDNPEAFYYIINGKIDEQIENITYILNQFVNQNGEYGYILKSANLNRDMVKKELLKRQKKLYGLKQKCLNKAV